MAAAFIVAGYVSLVWVFGWIGLLAVAAHLGVMLWAMR